MVQLVVKTLVSKAFQFELSVSSTVLDIKKKLSQAADMPIQGQVLVYQGQPCLHDSSTLKSLMVTNGDLFVIVFDKKKYNDGIKQSGKRKRTFSDSLSFTKRIKDGLNARGNRILTFNQFSDKQGYRSDSDSAASSNVVSMSGIFKSNFEPVQPAAITFDADKVAMITGMGFNENAAKRALFATR